MGELRLLNVGVIKGNNLEEYYQVMMESDGDIFELELNFKNKTIENFKKEILKDFIDHLERVQNDNLAVLSRDLKSGGEVYSYIEYHWNTLQQQATTKPLELNFSEAELKKHWANNLKLIRVALYPDGKYNKEYYATFDYALYGEVSNSVIAIKTDERGHFKYLTWES